MGGARIPAEPGDRALAGTRHLGRQPRRYRVSASPENAPSRRCAGSALRLWRHGFARHRRACRRRIAPRSEEHTSELQSLMRISYAVFCLKKKKTNPYEYLTNVCAYKPINVDLITYKNAHTIHRH